MDKLRGPSPWTTPVDHPYCFKMNFYQRAKQNVRNLKWLKLCQFLVHYMYIYTIVIFSILLLKLFLNSIHGFGFVRKEKQHLKGAGGDLWLNSS